MIIIHIEALEHLSLKVILSMIFLGRLHRKMIIEIEWGRWEGDIGVIT